MLKGKLLICIIVPLAIFGSVVYAQEDAPSIKKGQLLPVSKIYRSSKLTTFTETLSTTVFEEDFETGGSTWSTTGIWQIGSPTSGPNNGHESANCAATNLLGDYSISMLPSPPTNWHKYLNEPFVNKKHPKEISGLWQDYSNELNS